jgi:hypothetical protein
MQLFEETPHQRKKKGLRDSQLSKPVSYGLSKLSCVTSSGLWIDCTCR